MSDDGIVGYTERESMDPLTGAEGVLRKEWRVRPLGAFMASELVEAFGESWERWHPGATCVLEMRYIRRGVDEGWKPHTVANTRGQALEYIDDGAVAVDASFADLLERRRVAHEEALAAETKAAQLRAEAEADARGRKASEAAFDRMRKGSPAGALLADAWNSWVLAHSSDDKAAWTSNAEFMELYTAVMWSTTVPAKRKAIRALLGLYGREFLL